MTQLCIATVKPTSCSPLVLCDRLISLAQDADRAGYLGTAEHLVQLALGMFEEDGKTVAPRRPTPHRPRVRLTQPGFR
jgi:hypothetical protein